MEETTVNITEQDLGVILYENSNAKTVLDAPTGKIGAKGWAQRIYMILLGVLLLGWFVYSVVHKTAEVGISKAIVAHLASFFLLLMSEAILLLTAFNAWGKFARLALKHKSLTRQHGIEGVRTRQLDAELKAADANKQTENAIRIYRDYVVIVNKGVQTILSKSEIQRVKCDITPNGYQLIFYKYESGVYYAAQLLPSADLPLVNDCLDNLELPTAKREKGYLRKKLPILAFASVPILIGVALLVLRSLLLKGMPIIFGLVFTAFGLLFFIMQFNEVAIIHYGISSILGGILITGLPLGIALTIVDLVESISFTSVLTTFTPFHAVLSVFLGLGPLLIILGISGIVKCAKLRR